MTDARLLQRLIEGLTVNKPEVLDALRNAAYMHILSISLIFIVFLILAFITYRFVVNRDKNDEYREPLIIATMVLTLLATGSFLYLLRDAPLALKEPVFYSLVHFVEHR